MSISTTINYNKFLSRIKVLETYRQISSDFIISGGICDLLYLENIKLEENQDIGIHVFERNALYNATNMFSLSHYINTDKMEIHASGTDIIVFYLHNSQNNFPKIQLITANDFEYKIITKEMRKQELEIKLHMKYSQPAINNIDVKNILKLLLIYNQ